MTIPICWCQLNQLFCIIIILGCDAAYVYFLPYANKEYYLISKSSVYVSLLCWATQWSCLHPYMWPWPRLHDIYFSLLWEQAVNLRYMVREWRGINRFQLRYTVCTSQGMLHLGLKIKSHSIKGRISEIIDIMMYKHS